MVTTKIRITDDRLQDLLCCALEGGSNYWYQIVSYNYPRGQNIDSLNIEYPHLELPFKGGSITIEDSFEDFGAKVLDRDAIENGMDLLQIQHPRHFADFINENEDAITGDTFLQLCLYGEVIYG